MQGFRYLQDVVTLALDEAACIGCGRCAELCPHAVFTVAGGKARMADRDACIECGACALNCPVKAITVDAGVGCAKGIVNEWLQARRPGKNRCC